MQQAAKRYGDDGHSKDVGLRLLLLAAVILAAKALPPLTNIRQMTKRLLQCCRYGVQMLADLRCVKRD